MKLIVAVLAGSAAEALLLAKRRGTDATAFQVFETKRDDQVPVWDAAGKLWYDTSRRDAGVEQLAVFASRLVASEARRVEAVASALLTRTTLTPVEVEGLLRKQPLRDLARRMGVNLVLARRARGST